MVHSYAVLRGKFVTVHHDNATDRVGIIISVKDDSAKIIVMRGSQPSEGKNTYVPATKALVNTIGPEAWQPGRPVILSVILNADGMVMDTITILFDREDNPLSHL
jgi:hypothetical protein